jgi:phosphatidylserine/phosphatidylglycerophosphate/cardiolipin synthase-like enzyme
MFDPTDPDLIKALLGTSDRKRLLFGLLNNISDPSKAKKNKTDNLSASGEAPRAPSAATEVKVTLFNRSRKDKAVLAYSYFRPGAAPADFLPELNSVDFSSRSTIKPAKSGPKKRPPPAVHIHHKFIVVDAETTSPTIYTGSANLSNNSTHRNDENLLEITGAPELAQTYLAEFMRLYAHYRARALWNMSGKKAAVRFTLKTTRDQWVKGAYKAGTSDFVARTTLAVEAK